jgi:hypothetical protein
LYAASSSDAGDDLVMVGSAILDDHPVLSEIYDRWLRGEDYYPVLRGELLTSYYEQIKKAYSEQEMIERFSIPLSQYGNEQYGYFLAFSDGVIYGWSGEPIKEQYRIILKRFASVVDLTFKRYFELQKAETQTREAQIELGLER